MDNIVKLGFQQRIGDLERIGQMALFALADIALNHGNVEPGSYAKNTLDSLGVDLEISVLYLEQAMQHLEWPKDKG